MKYKIVIGLMVLLAIGVSTSFGAVGWAGDIWPCSGASYANNADISCYVQIWKAGYTDSPGRGDSLTAWLYYKKATDADYDSIEMSYLGDPSGGNDEYTAAIPSSATEGGVNEDWYINVYDSTDASWYIGAQTQGGCGNQSPPFYLVITPATSQDVTVTFLVDMSCQHPDWYPGGVFFTGDGPGWNWNPCDASRQMSDPDGDLVFEGQFTFPAGSNPSVQYKYNKHDGTNCNWEGTSNRTFTVDDSSPTQVLPIDIWDNWDCCTPSGPAEITGPGSYCITLCYLDERLAIPLNIPYDPPIIPNIVFSPGCELGPTPCDEVCEPGSGSPYWAVCCVAPGVYELQICLQRDNPDNWYGCFCMTIDQILPVELSTFEATALVNAVRLDWATASEKNNDYFAIEQSRDQATWMDIGHVDGAGTTPTGNNYSFTDENLVAGTTYYYRLTSVDIDGTRNDYEQIVSATPYGPEAVSDYSLSQNYPNPFNPTTTFNYTLKEAGMVTVKVFDITGREVATLVSEPQSVGKYSVTFDATSLPSGIYIYRLQANDFTAAHKMVLMK
ncbi:T9SS type A sorting domain-containing protein [bacterium]|nr:T9SS type A sorting domain-containing protein [bacterium]MBU1937620.1 T9SS type A sorting domain-containing protein [bacterium]